VLVSAELRWFWSEEEPVELASWFHSRDVHPFAPGGGETRVDRYLVDSQQFGLGIKCRGGKSGIEVKGLVSTFEPGLAVDPFLGPIEIWAKWASGSLSLDSHETIAIEKRRWLRKFDTAAGSPREMELDVTEKPARGEPFPESSCNVEFTVISLVGHSSWWTLGFESFGGLARVAQGLKAVAEVLASRDPPPMQKGLQVSYPEWLAKCVLPRVGAR